MQEIVIVCSLVEGTIGWRPAFVLFSLIPSHVQASYCLALVFFSSLPLLVLLQISCIITMSLFCFC